MIVIIHRCYTASICSKWRNKGNLYLPARIRNENKEAKLFFIINFIIFDKMKSGTSYRKLATKGDRLNWTPLKDVKPVQLNKKLAKGKQLTSKDLHKSTATRKVLVP